MTLPPLLRRPTLLMAAVVCLAPLAMRADDAQTRAIAALEQNVKSDPQNAVLWTHLGFAYRNAEKIDKAEEAFKKASSLDPKKPEPLFMLGLIYEKKNQNADALRVWKQYLPLVTDPEKREVAEKHIHHLSR